VSVHRRRFLLLAAAACVLAALGLAPRGAGDAAGPGPGRVDVVVAARPLSPGQRLTARDLTIVRVAAGPLAPHLLGDAAALAGRRVAFAVPAGAPVPAAALAQPAAAGGHDVALRLDEVAGAPAGDLAGALADLYVVRAGARPDVETVLEAVEVVSASAAGGQVVATVRVPPRAVAPLLGAESLGSLRLVVRPPVSDAAR
jgi:Flp pilus assembly protein CpaB